VDVTRQPADEDDTPDVVPQDEVPVVHDIPAHNAL